MKKLFLPLCALLLTSLSRADEASFTAEVDKTVVSMDDVVTLQITLSGEGLDGAKPVLPSLPGFRAGFSGRSQNISFVNGRVSSRLVYTYLLQPEAPGNHTIPALTLQAGGRTLATAPIAVKVVSAAGGAAAPPDAAGAAPPAVPAKDLFLTASVDKPSAVVGEPVTLTVRFYARARLLSQPSYAPPETTGFLKEDLPPERTFTEVHNGRRYEVVELKTALFPAAAGTQTVGPAALECRTEDFSDDGMSRDPFGGFFQNFFNGGKPVTLRSDPLRVAVRPLPDQGRPADFKGDVGQWRLAAALDKSAAALHEPVTLTVTVSGEGNVKALSAPDLPPLPGFKLYETLTSLNVSKAGWKVQGSKVFKTILKPEVSGRLEVPAIHFSYYDPASRAYKTSRADPLALTVTGAAASPAADPAGAAAPGADLKVITKDIRTLKPVGELRSRRRTDLFPWINLFPPLVFLGLWGARRWRARPVDTALLASRRARREAEKALAAARGAMEAGDPADAARALETALRDYFSGKTGLPAPGLTGPALAQALSRRGASEALLERTARLWDDVHALRYAPAGAPADVAPHIAAAAALLPDLEALWKK